MYWQEAANVLWCWNHETRRGEQDGDLMTAERQGGSVSRNQPSLWDAFVCWEVMHHSQFKSCALHCISSNTWQRGWIWSRLCVCHWEEGDSDFFFLGTFSALLLFQNARVSVCVFLQLAFSVFLYAQPKEERCTGVPVSGCVWSGSRLLVLRDPNSALRDSYSKPTHSSIRPWTTSMFLD